MGYECETVCIVGQDGNALLINAQDYDPENDELFVAAPPDDESVHLQAGGAGTGAAGTGGAGTVGAGAGGEGGTAPKPKTRKPIAKK